MDLREIVAREIEPLAWAALGLGDTLAYKSRRTSSQRKAARILAAIEASPITDEQIEAGAQAYCAYIGKHPQLVQQFPAGSTIVLNAALAAAYRAMLLAARPRDTERG